MKTGYAKYESPIGPVYIIADLTGIKRVEIFEEDWQEYRKNHDDLEESEELCGEAINQMDEYFTGKRKAFDLPLSIEGTDFRKQVWRALMEIPYGEVRSYGQLAEMIGNPKAVRAVGQANRSNQMPIIIPCHRVIGKNGDLIGFAGNRTPVQKKLLEAEGFCVK